MSKKDDKKPKLAYAMSLAAMEKFALESEEEISIYKDLIGAHISENEKVTSYAVLSSLCQGLTLCYQMLDVVNSSLEDPVFMKDSKEKIVVLEEDMYMIETLALSKIYCENQLRKLSISTKMH